MDFVHDDDDNISDCNANTRPFDMTVLNELDRFHHVMDTIERLPQAGDKGVNLKQQLQDKLIEHRQYNNKHGQDMPVIRDWKWTASVNTFSEPHSLKGRQDVI